MTIYQGRKEVAVETITISVADAKKRLSDYINRCSLGVGRVIITKRNRPMAAIVSLKDLEDLEQVEKRRGLLSLVHKWEGFEEVEDSIESAVRSRHAEGAGRDVPL